MKQYTRRSCILTIMSGLFNNSFCTQVSISLESSLLSKVTNTQNMFRRASSFDQPLADWDVSNLYETLNVRHASLHH